MRRIAMLLVVAVLCAGCYHVTVITGAPPAAQFVHIPWQHSFIGGLVSPPELRTDPPCVQGVSRVETKRSFMNGLVSWIVPLNIYTPIDVHVTCASGPVAR
ncbi:MAG TPA: hypothetical protein VIP11_21445 [Gemmatimonadaceae bacterium]